MNKLITFNNLNAMDIREQLLKEHSKSNTDLIAKYIGTDRTKIKELIDLFTKDEYRVGQRAAWVVSSIHDHYPALLIPHYTEMIKAMKEDKHIAIRRNVLRTLANSNFPKKYQEELLNVCFEYLTSNKQPVAVKVHAMRILGKICEDYPELKNELKLTIESQLPHASAGYKSCAKKVLMQITRE